MSTEKKQEPESTVPAKTDDSKLTIVQVFENQLSNYKVSIQSLLNAHGISPEEFMIQAANAVKRVPALLNAERKSLFGAILMSAELGLPPNTPMQLAFILPYNIKGKLEAQFQIGYQGWLEIVQRNPKIESIDSGVVYSNEKWHYNKGLRIPFSHEPLEPSKRGAPIGAYAIAWIRGSEKPKVVFLYREEILKFKEISQGASSKYSPWNDEEKDPQKWMWRKTCIKQLTKELPKTREMQKALHQDNAVEMGGSQTVTDLGYAETVENPDVEAKDKAETKKEKDKATGEGLANTIIADEKKAGEQGEMTFKK